MRASSEITALAGVGVERDVPRELPSGLSVEEAYRRHAHMVLRRARAILGDRSEALDVTQQIFLGLLDEPASFDGRSAITTWL